MLGLINVAVSVKSESNKSQIIQNVNKLFSYVC